MSEHVFSDLDRQLIVRLSDERLTYEPAAGTGWQCRVSDICWTSSRVSSRGIQELNLHGVDGRAVVTLLPFEGIERFYITLLRLLTERPIFDLVRENLPTQVPLLERTVRMADQTPAEERPWEFFRASEAGAVAATRQQILISTAEGHIEPIPWQDLAGLRSRGDVTRFFRASDYVEAPVAGLDAALDPLWTARKAELPAPPEYRPPGARAHDCALAMDYSWELSRAEADGLLDPDETVFACAFGTGEGSLVPGEPGPAMPGAAMPGAMSALGSVLAGVVSDRDLTRSELLLTSRRLLHVERDRATLEVLSQVEVELDRLPRLKQANGVLILGRFELLTDPGHPQMAREFLRRYQGLVHERFDPFGDHNHVVEAPASASLSRRERPDPFSPVLERPLSLED